MSYEINLSHEINLLSQSELKDSVDRKKYEIFDVNNKDYTIRKDKYLYVGKLKSIPNYILCRLINPDRQQFIENVRLSFIDEFNLFKKELNEFYNLNELVISINSKMIYHEYLSKNGNLIFSNDKNLLFDIMLNLDFICDVSTVLGDRNTIGKEFAEQILNTYLCLDINCNDSKYINFNTNKPEFYDPIESFNSISDLQYCLLWKLN